MEIRSVLCETEMSVGADTVTAVQFCGYGAKGEPFMMQLWREVVLKPGAQVTKFSVS